MEREVLLKKGKKINVSVEILTPIVSTRLANGELVSSFVGKKMSQASGGSLVVGEVYSIMAWNAMAEILRSKYKKGMLLHIQGVLSYMSMKLGQMNISRKTLVVTRIV